MPSSPSPPDLGTCARLACEWEANARKAGNVAPGHAFADLTVDDFYRSAVAIAPAIGAAAGRPVGATVLAAIQETRRVVASNTNLGIVLLLAPLAAVPRAQSLTQGIEGILQGLTVEDSRQVFAAIRLAQPGGLDKAPEQDVHGEPTLPLRDVMALAAERDLIARQYANGFREVLVEGMEILQAALARVGVLETAIIQLQLTLLASHPDSLIARKRGLQEAEQAGRRAREVLHAGWPDSPPGQAAFAELDAWLRADSNARNPGTTADLVTACLFAALREAIIPLPCPYPWMK